MTDTASDGAMWRAELQRLHAELANTVNQACHWAREFHVPTGEGRWGDGCSPPGYPLMGHADRLERIGVALKVACANASLDPPVPGWDRTTLASRSRFAHNPKTAWGSRKRIRCWWAGWVSHGRRIGETSLAPTHRVVLTIHSATRALGQSTIIRGICPRKRQESSGVVGNTCTIKTVVQQCLTAFIGHTKSRGSKIHCHGFGYAALLSLMPGASRLARPRRPFGSRPTA